MRTGTLRLRGGRKEGSKKASKSSAEGAGEGKTKKTEKSKLKKRSGQEAAVPKEEKKKKKRSQDREDSKPSKDAMKDKGKTDSDWDDSVRAGGSFDSAEDLRAQVARIGQSGQTDVEDSYVTSDEDRSGGGSGSGGSDAPVGWARAQAEAKADSNLHRHIAAEIEAPDMSWQAAVAAEEKRQRASDEAEGPDATSSSVEEASEDGGEHGSSEESGAGGEAADGSLAASQLPKPKAKKNKHKKGMDYYLEDAEGGDMQAQVRAALGSLARAVRQRATLGADFVWARVPSPAPDPARPVARAASRGSRLCDSAPARRKSPTVSPTGAGARHSPAALPRCRDPRGIAGGGTPPPRGGRGAASPLRPTRGRRVSRRTLSGLSRGSPRQPSKGARRRCCRQRAPCRAPATRGPRLAGTRRWARAVTAARARQVAGRLDEGAGCAPSPEKATQWLRRAAAKAPPPPPPPPLSY